MPVSTNRASAEYHNGLDDVINKTDAHAVLATKRALREGQHGATAHPALTTDRIGIFVELEAERSNTVIQRETDPGAHFTDVDARDAAFKQTTYGFWPPHRRIIQRAQRAWVFDRDDGKLGDVGLGTGRLSRGQPIAARIERKPGDKTQRHAR